MFTLPNLPYSRNSLSPYISEKTIHYHYDKHHKKYVDNLNALLVNRSDLINKSLKEIVLISSGSIFNNAAQVWNHNFYWNCLSPFSDIYSCKKLIIAIENNFQNIDLFKNSFIKSSLDVFGSGWTWLVKVNNNLEIRNTSNADCPLSEECIPLLVCDVWEHAYYIDYMNQRIKYVESFWKLINWNFVESQLLAF